MISTELINVLKRGERLEEGIYELKFDRAIEKLLVSWNCVLNETQCIAIGFRVGNDSDWSEEYKLGNWELAETRMSFGTQKSNFGRLAIDHFIADKDHHIDKMRLYIRSLSGNKADLTGLYVSCKYREDSVADGQEIDDNHGFYACRVEAPAFVQLPIEDIGNRICSPTTCAMMIATQGIDARPEAVAKLAFDNGSEIYGNWSFNMAAISQYGLKSAVRHFDSLHEISRIISETSQPIGASVKTGKEAGFTGALQGYPEGHLLLIVGFEQSGEQWRVLVHDPADHDSESSKRAYEAKEFERFFSGVGYQIQP